MDHVLRRSPFRQYLHERTTAQGISHDRGWHERDANTMQCCLVQNAQVTRYQPRIQLHSK